MRRSPGEAVVQLRFPPVEQFQTVRGIMRLVSQIICPAAIGVDVAEMLPQSLGQEPAGDRKVLVVLRGEPAAISFSVGRRYLRHSSRRSVAFKFSSERSGHGRSQTS